MNGGGSVPDVVVVGAGVIGCSIAWHLRRSGASVMLLERGQVGDGASSAAAGMLAPFSESSRPGPFADFALFGLQTFREEADELQAESGIDVEFRRDGILRIAESEAQGAALRAAMPWQQQMGADVRWLDGPDVADLEPALRRLEIGGVYSATEGQVNPILLTRALAGAAVRRGVHLREECSVDGLQRRGERVVALQTSCGPIPVEHLILAGGAWSSAGSAALGAALGVFPVRGQMAAFSQPEPALRRVVYSADGYLVPKNDGSVFVGATEEEDAGFDAVVTVEGLAWLLGAARRLLPKAGGAHFLRAWAGLRPCAPDRLPLLGPLPGLTNVTVATGHFRNGILLSLATGRLVSQQFLGQRTAIDLAAFATDRVTLAH